MHSVKLFVAGNQDPVPRRCSNRHHTMPIERLTTLPNQRMILGSQCVRRGSDARAHHRHPSTRCLYPTLQQPRQSITNGPQPRGRRWRGTQSRALAVRGRPSWRQRRCPPRQGGRGHRRYTAGAQCNLRRKARKGRGRKCTQPATPAAVPPAKPTAG